MSGSVFDLMVKGNTFCVEGREFEIRTKKSHIDIIIWKARRLFFSKKSIYVMSIKNNKI